MQKRFGNCRKDAGTSKVFDAMAPEAPVLPLQAPKPILPILPYRSSSLQKSQLKTVNAAGAKHGI
jgi:hypothetical protein